MLRQTRHVQNYQRNIWIKQRSITIRNRVTAMVTQVLKTEMNNTNAGDKVNRNELIDILVEKFAIIIIF